MKKQNLLQADNFSGVISVLLAAILTSLGVYALTQLPAWAAWIGWPLIAISMWHWFSITHSAGHNSQFKSKLYNLFAGTFASLFSGIPFFPWRKIHFLHHRWNGTPGKDPTFAAKDPEKISPTLKKIINFIWRNHIPIFGIVFLASTFYNLKNSLKWATDYREKLLFIFSVLFIILIHLSLFLIYKSTYCYVVFPSVFLFCFSADTVLISQHTYLPAHTLKKKYLTAEDQDSLTRTLHFLPWIDRFIFAQFANHTVHHIYPYVPHYFLHKVEFDSKYSEAGWHWYRSSHQLSATTLFFEKPKV